MSAFLISLAGSENSTGRERLSGEKHKHLFHVNFMQHRSLHKEMKTPQKMVKLKRLYVSFEEEWKVVERYNRASVVN